MKGLGKLTEPKWWNDIPIKYIIGNRYHCTWQGHADTIYKLLEVNGDICKIQWREKEPQWTYLNTLRTVTDTKGNTGGQRINKKKKPVIKTNVNTTGIPIKRILKNSGSNS